MAFRLPCARLKPAGGDEALDKPQYVRCGKRPGRSYSRTGSGGNVKGGKQDDMEGEEGRYFLTQSGKKTRHRVQVKARMSTAGRKGPPLLGKGGPVYTSEGRHCFCARSKGGANVSLRKSEER